MITINNNQLQMLLNFSKRKQTVNGKPQAQVDSCVLVIDSNSNVEVLSLTRDMLGLTYIEGHGVGSEGGMIPIPDIDTVLGILKMHSQDITLTYDKDKSKLRMKSGRKQTTLDASLDAKAFSHSTETLFEFYEKSKSFADRLEEGEGDWVYTTNKGDKIHSKWNYTMDCNDLYEALRCDNINGQRLNRYTFDVAGGEMHISVGDPAYGETTTALHIDSEHDEWSCVFDGGLDEVFKYFSGNCNLHLFDFREYGQGIRLLVSFNNGAWVLQAGLVD